jgi:hypothetical protein
MSEKKNVLDRKEQTRLKVEAKVISTKPLYYNSLQKKFGKSKELVKKVVEIKPQISLYHSSHKDHVPNVAHFSKIDLVEKEDETYAQCFEVVVRNKEYLKYFNNNYGFSVETNNELITKDDNNNFVLEEAYIDHICVVPDPRSSEMMNTYDSSDSEQDIFNKEYENNNFFNIQPIQPKVKDMEENKSVMETLIQKVDNLVEKINIFSSKSTEQNIEKEAIEKEAMEKEALEKEKEDKEKEAKEKEAKEKEALDKSIQNFTKTMDSLDSTLKEQSIENKKLLERVAFLEETITLSNFKKTEDSSEVVSSTLNKDAVTTTESKKLSALELQSKINNFNLTKRGK